MSAVMTLPAVLIPSDMGVTSRRRSCIFSDVSPGGLDSDTICDSLIWVNTLVRLLSIEEVRA